MKTKRDEEFERQRQIVEKRRVEEEKRRVEEERQKKEREWRIWFMNLKVEDLKKWVKTLTDEQILNLPYKNTYMPRSRSSLNDDWNYAQSYEAFDDELKKIKKQAQKRVDQKERERYYEELKSQGIDPFQ